MYYLTIVGVTMSDSLYLFYFLQVSASLGQPYASGKETNDTTYTNTRVMPIGIAKRAGTGCEG
jgi:hypothetical protein